MSTAKLKNMNKRLASTCLALLLSTSSMTVKAGSFTSLDLLAHTIAGGLQCLNWRIVGLCVSLKCGLFGCKVVTVPKIKHNLPDLVFSAFQQPGDNPWVEARLLHGTVAKAGLQALMSPYSPITDSGDLSSANSHLQGATINVAFNDVHAIGNPHASIITRAKMGVSFLCRSSVKPMFPYILTELDAIAWRFELIEAAAHPASYIPGLREIGNWPANTWGSVFPRIGSLQQVDPPKAAAVAVQRAADIVTQVNQVPHVYVPYASDEQETVLVGDITATTQEACEGSGGEWDTTTTLPKCLQQQSAQWLPEGNEKTDWWQMISPIRTQCEHFGAAGEWSSGKQSDDERFAWIYWREYECCMPTGGIFLFSIP